MAELRSVLQLVHEFTGGDKCAAGKAGGHALSDHQDVGYTIELFQCKKRPAPPKSGLDLIQDQQGPDLVAALPHHLEVTVHRQNETGTSLYGFQDHGRSAFSNLFKVFHGIETDVPYIRNQGSEGTFSLFHPKEAQTAHGIAVIGLVCRNDLGATRG